MPSQNSVVPAFNGFYADKIAVVTGAGSGIGRAIACLLDQCGAKVHCADVDGSAAASVAATLRRGRAHTLDVTDADSLRALADAIYAEEGRVDLLFNNAGIGHAALVTETELDDWRRLLEVNVMGVVNGIHAFLPRLLAQPTVSHIVNTASGAGLLPHPRMAPYSASKHAVVGLSTSLAAELHGSKVKVTVLCPGVINTAIARSTLMRGDTGTRHPQAVAYYQKYGATPDRVASDLLRDVRKGKLFCLTPWSQIGVGWLIYRLSPRIAMSLMRAQIDKVLGIR
jgi:NAD(P)-dependent dehydrogenase (short-subunit alcohol dehydrogenase family)